MGGTRWKWPCSIVPRTYSDATSWYWLHLPWWLARAQAAFLEGVFPRLLGKPPPLNRDQLIMLREDNVGDPEPAMELFGLGPEPFREGIGRYLGRKA